MSVPPGLRRLLKHLETRCSADCCRSSAFEIETTRIVSWLLSEPSERRDRVRDALTAAISGCRLPRTSHPSRRTRTGIDLAKVWARSLPERSSSGAWCVPDQRTKHSRKGSWDLATRGPMTTPSASTPQAGS